MPQISETVRRNFDVQVRKVVVVHRPARATEEKVDAAPPRSRRRLSAAEPFLDCARHGGFETVAAARERYAAIRAGRGAPLGRRDAAWVLALGEARAAERAAAARVDAATRALARLRGSTTSSASSPQKAVASAYSFTTGAPAATEVLVGPGFVRRPERADAAIVPAASASSPLFVFADETVARLHASAFAEGLRRLGHSVHLVPAPEAKPTLKDYAALADRVLSLGMDKHSVLFAVGGTGVVDVTGFVAATLHRGVGLIHVPTTLGAAAAAVATVARAVDVPRRGRRVVGFDYPAIRIVLDPDVLQTLDGAKLARDVAKVAPPHLRATDDLGALLRAVVEARLP